MSELKHVMDGTRENFPQLVLENSHRGPVLVNYWTPNAGPCFKLWQALETLSQEYCGRFLLVNINTETQTSLVRDNGITSVPTVKIYHQGNIVESIHGAESESSLRNTIDKYVAPAMDTDVAQAIKTYQSGNVDEALAILARAAMEQPDNQQLHATSIKLLLRERRYEDIDAYCSVLPASVQQNPEINTLRIHAKMLQLAKQAAPAEELDEQLEKNPDDLAALMSRASIAMVQDEYELALQHLFGAFRADRQHEDELARKAMLVIFGLLGERHELTLAYQKQLRDLLH